MIILKKLKKNIERFLYREQQVNINCSCYTQSGNLMYLFHCLWSLKIVELLRNPAVIFYMLYNNFFYVLLSFVFHLQKDFFCCSRRHWSFFSFYFWERFWYLSLASFRSLSLFFWEYPVDILIYVKKNIWLIFHTLNTTSNYLKSLVITWND